MALAEAKAIRLGHPSYVWRRGQDRRLQQMREHVSLENRRILDIGCGLGMYISQFRQFSDQVYGVDIDAEKIAQASRSLPNLSVSPAEKLPFPDEYFDVILLNEVIEHVNDDRQSIREAYRCLRPGGHILIYAPNRLYPFETHGFFVGKRYFFRLLPFINYFPGQIRDVFCPHARVYTASRIVQLFDGLKTEIVAQTHIFPGLDNWASRGFFGRMFRDTVHALEESPFRRFGISHFIVAKKTA
jgi:ubiquinone/menaquinone biosynthesis C-methylase UbiE